MFLLNNSVFRDALTCLSCSAPQSLGAAWGAGRWMRWSLRSHPTQTLLGFYERNGTKPHRSRNETEQALCCESPTCQGWDLGRLQVSFVTALSASAQKPFLLWPAMSSCVTWGFCGYWNGRICPEYVLKISLSSKSTLKNSSISKRCLEVIYAFLLLVFPWWFSASFLMTLCSQRSLLVDNPVFMEKPTAKSGYHWCCL